MKLYNWTNGKEEIKKFREISNKSQGVFSENETMRIFLTDKIIQHTNENYDTRFEEVK